MNVGNYEGEDIVRSCKVRAFWDVARIGGDVVCM